MDVLASWIFPSQEEVCPNLSKHSLRQWPYRRYHACPIRKSNHYPCSGCPRGRNRTTYLDACNALWLVTVEKWTQTNAGIYLGLNQGTVSRIVRGLRFRGAHPVPVSRLRLAISRRFSQDEFEF